MSLGTRSSQRPAPDACASLTVFLLLSGCVPTTNGVLRILNGATTPAQVTNPLNARDVGVARYALTDPGHWRLSPATMSVQVTGISLLPVGYFEPHATILEIEGCTATYDRALGSLVELSACALPVPVGTFGGLTLLYDPTFELVMDDAVAGIYSDPSAPGQLVTTRPAGGPGAIRVTDPHASTGRGRGTATQFFPSPVTIAEDDTFVLSLVFDPTHWPHAELLDDGFQPPKLGGEAPLMPAPGGLGKAALYSNLPSTASFNLSGRTDPPLGFLFLYADERTPATVLWQQGTVCPGGPMAAYAGDGTEVGTWGRLGLDADGVLAWASAAPVMGDKPPRTTGYTGVYRMNERQALGETTTLSYRCTSEVPPTSGGATYASGAPDFVPDGARLLTLLAK